MNTIYYFHSPSVGVGIDISASGVELGSMVGTGSKVGTGVSYGTYSYSNVTVVSGYNTFIFLGESVIKL